MLLLLATRVKQTHSPRSTASRKFTLVQQDIKVRVSSLFRHIAHITKDVADMLNDPDIDFIYNPVSLPLDLHSVTDA